MTFKFYNLEGGPGGLDGAGRAVSARALKDSMLLAGLKGGDASIAMAFFDRIRPHIDRILGRFLRRDDCDGDDLRQLAAIELFTTIGRFRGECSLEAWVGALTSRVVFKHLRRRNLERRVFVPLEDEESMRSAATTDPVLQDVLRYAARHIESMELNRATAVFLHDVLGYELREIARTTGTSVAAAQSRLVRGRRELRERFANDPEVADLLGSRLGLAPTLRRARAPTSFSTTARARR